MRIGQRVLRQKSAGLLRLGERGNNQHQEGKRDGEWSVHANSCSDSREPDRCRGHWDPATAAQQSPVSLRFLSLSIALRSSGRSNAAAIRLTLCVQLGLRVLPRNETPGNDPCPIVTPCRAHHSHHGGREEGILLPEEEYTARIRAALCGLIRRVLGSLRHLGSAQPHGHPKPRGRGTEPDEVPSLLLLWIPYRMPLDLFSSRLRCD